MHLTPHDQPPGPELCWDSIPIATPQIEALLAPFPPSRFLAARASDKAAAVKQTVASGKLPVY